MHSNKVKIVTNTTLLTDIITSLRYLVVSEMGSQEGIKRQYATWWTYNSYGLAFFLSCIFSAPYQAFFRRFGNADYQDVYVTGFIILQVLFFSTALKHIRRCTPRDIRATCAVACTNQRAESDDVSDMLVCGNGWRPAGRPCAQCTPHDRDGASMTSHSGRSQQRCMAADTSRHSLASCRHQQYIHLQVCDCCAVRLHTYTRTHTHTHTHQSYSHSIPLYKTAGPWNASLIMAAL